MFAFLSKLFSPTVDSVISDITKKIEQLHAVAELHALEAQAKAKVIAEANVLKTFAEGEYSRAKVIAGKLAALVS
jgi:hypothetical protein